MLARTRQQGLMMSWMRWTELLELKVGEPRGQEHPVQVPGEFGDLFVSLG